MITETLFYKGGTLSKDDIVKTTNKEYDFALNSSCMFIFNKSGKLLKTVKIEYNNEWTFKILKTKVILSSSFKEQALKAYKEDFATCIYDCVLNKVMTKVKGV